MARKIPDQHDKVAELRQITPTGFARPIVAVCRPPSGLYRQKRTAAIARCNSIPQVRIAAWSDSRREPSGAQHLVVCSVLAFAWCFPACAARDILNRPRELRSGCWRGIAVKTIRLRSRAQAARLSARGHNLLSGEPMSLALMIPRFSRSWCESSSRVYGRQTSRLSAAVSLARPATRWHARSAIGRSS